MHFADHIDAFDLEPGIPRQTQCGMQRRAVLGVVDPLPREQALHRLGHAGFPRQREQLLPDFRRPALLGQIHLDAGGFQIERLEARRLLEQGLQMNLPHPPFELLLERFPCLGLTNRHLMLSLSRAAKRRKTYTMAVASHDSCCARFTLSQLRISSGND